PLGNQVVHRTAGDTRHVNRVARLAKWDAAVHAASGLRLSVALGHFVVNLFPVAQPNDRIPIGWQTTFQFYKSCRLSHILKVSYSLNSDHFAASADRCISKASTATS